MHKEGRVQPALDILVSDSQPMRGISLLILFTVCRGTIHQFSGMLCSGFFWAETGNDASGAKKCCLQDSTRVSFGVIGK
jgi:hypothetical protein